MPTNYGVQGPNLGQYGADTQYASPVVGQEEGIPIGGSGAGFLPSQQELRRLSEQNEKRARNQQMAQELQKILMGMETTSNYGLQAGMAGMPTPGFGFEGFGGNQAKAQQLRMQNLGTEGGAVDSFSSMLDNALGIPSGGPSFGLGMGGGGNYFGGGDIGSIGGGGGMGAGFDLGAFG